MRLLYNIGGEPGRQLCGQRKTIEEVLPKIPCIVTTDMESSQNLQVQRPRAAPAPTTSNTIGFRPAHLLSCIWRTRLPIHRKGKTLIFGPSPSAWTTKHKAFYAKSNRNDAHGGRYRRASRWALPSTTSREKGRAGRPREHWIHWEEQRWPTLSGRLNSKWRIPALASTSANPSTRTFTHMPHLPYALQAYDERAARTVSPVPLLRAHKMALLCRTTMLLCCASLI